jgi:hypothetical protein
MAATAAVALVALVAGCGRYRSSAPGDFPAAAVVAGAQAQRGPCTANSTGGACPPVGPVLGSCPVFPGDNPWNTDISQYPVDPRSSAYLARLAQIGGSFVHPDFGSNPTYGFPFVVVPATQPAVPIAYNAYGDQSDPGPFPIPLNAPVESGSDHHVIAVQQGSCQLFELFAASRSGSGWVAASGARFDLRSNALRPAGWTSADAAGLPIFPGLVRYDEVAAGQIQHALRVTFAQTQEGYISPARHWASTSTDPNLPPMGLRLRLKASYDISHFTGESLVVLKALRTYGMIVADNGSNWYISGSTDSRWNDDDLDQLKHVPAGAFEVVATGAIQH